MDNDYKVELDTILNENIYTLPALESILSVGRRQLYRYINEEPKQLEALKIGGKWVVTESSLRRFLDSRKNI